MKTWTVTLEIRVPAESATEARRLVRRHLPRVLAWLPDASFTTTENPDEPEQDER